MSQVLKLCLKENLHAYSIKFYLKILRVILLLHYLLLILFINYKLKSKFGSVIKLLILKYYFFSFLYFLYSLVLNNYSYYKFDFILFLK